MHAPDEPRLSCSSCARCPTANCPARNDEEEPRLHGPALGLAAAGLFLGPIALAIAGSVCAGDDRGMQLVGALSGLLLGICASVLCVRIARRQDRGGACHSAPPISEEGYWNQ